MRMGRLYRQSECLIARAWRAERAIERMRGLLGRPALEPGEALLITPCSSIHTLGMRYALDIAFVDAAERVLKLCRGVVPLRMAMAWGAASTVEMPAGEIDRLRLAVGDRLEWRPV